MVRTGLLVAVSAILCGCILSRWEIEVPIEESANPDVGQEFKLVRVTDARLFQIDPSGAFDPSLKDDAIDDASITSRAIARWGAPNEDFRGDSLGDILLPEGQTVAALVTTSLTNGLRENGYRVLSNGDTGYESAIPLEIDIESFWGWWEQGMWVGRFHYLVRIDINSLIGPFADGKKYESQVARRYAAGGEESWRVVIGMALDEINGDIAMDIAAYDSSDSQSGDEIEDRLRRLKRLHDEGLITDEEYQVLRNQIIEEL